MVSLDGEHGGGVGTMCSNGCNGRSGLHSITGDANAFQPAGTSALSNHFPTKALYIEFSAPAGNKDLSGEIGPPQARMLTAGAADSSTLHLPVSRAFGQQWH